MGISLNEVVVGAGWPPNVRLSTKTGAEVRWGAGPRLAPRPVTFVLVEAYQAPRSRAKDGSKSKSASGRIHTDRAKMSVVLLAE